jgi:hypothetical protein
MHMTIQTSTTPFRKSESAKQLLADKLEEAYGGDLHMTMQTGVLIRVPRAGLRGRAP